MKDSVNKERYSPLFSLEGKTALVTGGSGNLGSSICHALATQGASVITLYYQAKEKAETLVQELKRLYGVQAFAVQADLRTEESVQRAFAAIEDYSGRLDILINNSGVFTESSQNKLPDADWDNVLQTNLKSLLYCSRNGYPYLAKTHGSIVSIASINGLHPGFGGTAHYDASKGGVLAYTSSLAAEYAAAGIRVNAVSPGLIDAEGLHNGAPHLVERFIRRAVQHTLVAPEDVAAAVVFLASDAAKAITGQNIVVDCGYLIG